MWSAVDGRSSVVIAFGAILPPTAAFLHLVNQGAAIDDAYIGGRDLAGEIQRDARAIKLPELNEG